MLDQPEPNIDDIVTQVLSGDQESYRYIVSLCEVKVRLVLAAILPDSAMVDDITQEVFVTAYQKLSDYQKGTEFFAWIKAIARNLGRNERRRWQRKLRHQKAYHNQLMIEKLIASPLDAVAEQISKETLGVLRGCVELLASNARHVVSEYYFKDESCQDIASRHGKTGSWARLVLHRARLALAECLQEKGGINGV